MGDCLCFHAISCKTISGGERRKKGARSSGNLAISVDSSPEGFTRFLRDSSLHEAAPNGQGKEKRGVPLAGRIRLFVDSYLGSQIFGSREMDIVNTMDSCLDRRRESRRSLDNLNGVLKNL